MAEHLDAGSRGEEWAVAHLREMGYEILFQNWRHKHWEVDIIAKDGDVLVFIEVKSRKSTAFGLPYEFVDRRKQQNLIKAADAFLESNSYFGDIRFDIVSVFLISKKIELIKDAFWSE